MENTEKYFLKEPRKNACEVDEDGNVLLENIIHLDDNTFPEAKLYFAISWYNKTMMSCIGSHIHDTAEYVGFIGSDAEHPQELYGKVLFWLNGQWITIEKSAIIYIPAGMPHCPYIVQEVEKPILHFSGTPNAHYTMKASIDVVKGMGDVNRFVSYEPRPFMPGTETDPSILRKAVWLDSSIIPGAPYIEFAWFLKPRETKPPKHVHDFDAIVGFIGSDPDDPGDLGAILNFDYDGETVRTDRSTVVYIPAGTQHCPFSIGDMKRPVLSFSGGNGSRY